MTYDVVFCFLSGLFTVLPSVYLHQKSLSLVRVVA